MNLNDQEEALDLLKLQSPLPHAGRSQPVLWDTNLQGGSWSSQCIVHERMAAISFTLGPVPAGAASGRKLRAAVLVRSQTRLCQKQSQVCGGALGAVKGKGKSSLASCPS